MPVAGSGGKRETPMKAPFQDGILQAEIPESDENERISSQEARSREQQTSDLHAGGQRAAEEHAKKAGQAGSENEALAGAYRTRWLAWAVIAAGWAGCLAAVLLRGGAVESFMMAVLTMIIAVSGIAPIMAASGLSAVRVLSGEVTREGGQHAVRLTLSRSWPVPFVWLAVQDETVNESSAANRGISVRTVFTPLLGKEMTFRYTLHKLRRGRHPFGHVSVTVGDWLGLTAIQKRIESKAVFVVLPGLPQADIPYQLERAGAAAQAAPALPAGEAPDLRGEAGRAEIEAAVRAAGIGPDSRPYREGDSLRHLDWRSAAKGRSLQTKVHTLEQPVKTVIAVDTLASAYERDDRLFDACVGWAALAVTQAASYGGAVTLLLGQDQAAFQSPFDGDNQTGLSGMLHAMALLRADGKGSLAGSLAKGANSITRGCTILAFTADWRGGRSWGELAGYAAEQGCRLELFIVTRSSVPSFAMREQQKWLESGGVKVTWLHVPSRMDTLPYAEEGGAAHELA
jgi:uncharacterized protein (DUF58 family)